jgi:uncharacterized repeat protein (TIGR03803 family)
MNSPFRQPLSSARCTVPVRFSEIICQPCIGNWDGAGPSAGLVLSSSTLFGTASYAGNFGKGTLFAVDTNGTGFTPLYTFTGGADGEQPMGELVLSGNTLYGTTAFGGSLGHGTLFSLDTEGTAFTNFSR